MQSSTSNAIFSFVQFRPTPRRVRRVAWLLLCLAAWAAALSGCAQSSLEFTEVTRIDEKVTENDLAEFLRIVDELPDHKLPELPPIFAPPAEWDKSRTLTVSGLVNEEQNQIEERWKVDWLARRLQKNRSLLHAVQREHLTLEQFVGLYLAIGVALSRATLHDEHDLDQIVRDGKDAIDKLKENESAFHSLRPEVMHYVLRQATWITRADRGKRLKMVPPENLALVRNHWDELTKIFPEDFKVNPLDAVADLLDEQGLPFEELGGVRDADIEWSPEHAHLGHALPDSDAESADAELSDTSDAFPVAPASPPSGARPPISATRRR